LPAPLKMPAAN